MKIDEQRKYKEVLEGQILPILTDPNITDYDTLVMYGKTKLEIATSYLELFAKKLG